MKNQNEQGCGCSGAVQEPDPRRTSGSLEKLGQGGLEEKTEMFQERLKKSK